MIDIKLLKALIRGALTYVPGINFFIKKKKQRSRHSAASAEFCYSYWLSILVHMRENNIKYNFEKIGEIGNGGSIGIGICALLTGTKKYYALEIEDLINIKDNLIILDEIVQLFKNKTPISNQFKRINLKINNYEYPKDLVPSNLITQGIISELKNDINCRFVNSKRVIVIKNWTLEAPLNLDFLFSRAVMEHVNNPALVNKGIESHLKMNSYLLHDIEFHSHGVTEAVDGHFLISKPVWKIVYGNRDYYLNRWRLKEHLSDITKKRFQIIKTQNTYHNAGENNEKILFGATILAMRY